MDGAEERIRQLEARLATVEAALSSLSGARSDAEKADAEIADLKMRVDGLEFREATGEDEGGGDGGGSDNEEQYGYPSALADSDAEYPFHVVYDDGDMDGEDEGKWKIYLPDGCVKVGNEEALFEGSESVVDRDADGYAEIVSPAETMYCNVRSSGGEWSYTIDGEQDYDSEFSFKVVGFDDEGDDASETAIQYANGIVVLGGASVSVDRGCWKISDGALVNKFFAIGGTLYEYGDAVLLNEFVMKGELEPGEEYTDEDLPFVALVVDLGPSNYGDASVGGYATFADMQSAAEEPTQLVRPLYKLTHTGGVAIDFRNMPLIAAGEMES